MSTHTNFAEKIRVMRVFDASVVVAGSSVAGSLGKCSSGIFVAQILTKANPDNGMDVAFEVAPAGSTTFVGLGHVHFVAGAAAPYRSDYLLSNSLPVNGSVRITTSNVVGTADGADPPPTMWLQVYLIAYNSRRLPTSQAWLVGFDELGFVP